MTSPGGRSDATIDSTNAHALTPGGSNASSQGRTDWSSMSVADILAKISSMTESSASGDANAIKAALDAVDGVVQALTTSFGDDSMLGFASDGSRSAGAAVAREIAAAAESVRPAIDALDDAQRVLTNTSAQHGPVSGIAARMRAHPEHAAELRAEVASLMERVYTSPMVDVQTWLPELPSATSESLSGSTFGSGAWTGTTGQSGRAQAGNLAESDQGISHSGTGYGGAPSAPSTGTSTSARRSGGDGPGGPQGVTAASADQGSDSGPDAMSRGGVGSADASGVHRVGTLGTEEQGNRTANDGSASRKPGSLSTGGAGSSGTRGDLGEGSVGFLAPSVGAPLLSGSGAGPSMSGPSPNQIPPAAMRPGPQSAIPPAGGGGGRDRGDNKHPSARYLNTREHGEEIVGDLPLVGPPVIGDWVPQSMPPCDPGADTSAANPEVGIRHSDGDSTQRSRVDDRDRGDRARSGSR